MTAPPSSANDAMPDGVPWLSWLARTALVTLALSIAAAQAPARVKLLGLFSIVVGGALGLASAWITKPHPTRVPRRFDALLCGMACCGLVAATWLAFRAEAAALGKSPQHQMASAMMKQMERDSGGEIAAAPAVTVVEEFDRYLARRVRQLGVWSSPWPLLFWIVELIAGAVAAQRGFRIGIAQFRQSTVVEETAP